MPQVLFRAIRAKPANWQAFYNEIARTMDNEVKPDLLAYFERVTKSWRNQQAFKAIRHISASEASVDVKPIGENADIWRYVSRGTRGPYPIPKPSNTRAKTLRFKWAGPGSYKARTNTRGGYGGPGKATGPTRMFKRVMHPGIKARNFEKHIARWYAQQFRRTMKNAVTRGLRRAKA